MKILIVTQYFWPENFRINDLAVGFVERGHEVTVLTGIPNYPEGKIYEGYGIFKKLKQDYHGVKVRRVPLIPRGKGRGLSLIANYFSFAFLGSILGPFLCRDKYDIIFVCQLSPVTIALPAIVLKKLKNIPLLMWVQDLWPNILTALNVTKSKVILGMVGSLVRFIYRSCDRILFQSMAFKPYLMKEGVPPERFIYYPNFAEALYKPVEPDNNSSQAKAMPEGFNIMFAGNIGECQDFPTILKAAEQLTQYKDIHWVVLGDGRMRQWVQEQVEERGLSDNFHLLGIHPMESMPGFFAQANALLVTLKRDLIFSLIMPSKVQSYLACAKPIIAALDGEGARIIKESGAGLTVDAEDSTALAEAVLSMYKMSDDKRRVMGENGVEYFDVNFQRDSQIDKLEKIFFEEIS